MHVSDALVVEPFVRYLFRRDLDLCPMGAFSYTVTSQLNAEFSCGRYCSIAGGVRLMGIPHPVDRVSTSPALYAPRFRALARDVFDTDVDFPPFSATYGKVMAGNDVWIGQHATLRGGIAIGDGAVIGANACVTRDVPPYAIVAGNPARVIRYRFREDIVERLLAVKWWRYAFHELSGLDPTDPTRFLDGLEEREARETISPFEPEPMRLAAALAAVESA